LLFLSIIDREEKYYILQTYDMLMKKVRKILKYSRSILIFTSHLLDIYIFGSI
jgi:hypothetical protein